MPLCYDAGAVGWGRSDFDDQNARVWHRKSTVASATWKSISQPQANSQAGQVRVWRAGIVLSDRITWAEVVFYKFHLHWWQWVKTLGRQRKEALEKSQAQTRVTFSRCGSSVWRSSAAVVGLGEACVWEYGLTAPPRGAVNISQQHLSATSPAPPPSLFFPLFFAASNYKHMRTVSRPYCQAGSALWAQHSGTSSGLPRRPEKPALELGKEKYCWRCSWCWKMWQNMTLGYQSAQNKKKSCKKSRHASSLQVNFPFLVESFSHAVLFVTWDKKNKTQKKKRPLETQQRDRTQQAIHFPF